MPIRVVVFLLASSPCSAAAQVPGAATTSGAQAGLTRVVCEPEVGTVRFRFRGAIIETGDPADDFEVVLSTSHGLPATANQAIERCFVEGNEGAPHPIREIHRPPARGRGPIDDWVVLSVEGRFDGVVGRLPLDDESHAVGSQVRLPLFYAPTEIPCAITESELSDIRTNDELFAHSCRAWPGLSGSPVVTTRTERPAILGIHLGSMWMIDERMNVEVGRYVDAVIVDAIEDAIARARAGRSH